MNLFKRAWWRLVAHLGKTAMLVGLFFVICTLVLSGFLIQSSAARAADDAKKSVGAVATMQLDVDALIASGGASKPNGAQGGTIGAGGNLYSGPVDKIGKTSKVVSQYNFTAGAAAAPSGDAKLYQPVPPPAGTDTGGTDFFKAEGIRDTAAVPDFRNGSSKITSGSGITPRTTGNAVMLEERMAKLNHLKVGDKVRLKVGEIGVSNHGKDIEFTVVGIFKNENADTGLYTPAIMDPGNQIYVSPEGASVLRGTEPGAKGSVIEKATFTLRDPDDLDQLKKDAKAAGVDPEIFPLSVNDKQYKTLVGPINKTAGFATLTVWLVSVAGAVILGLIITSSLRERRKELGILLALGEKKPKLLGQHLVEVVACALIAIGLSAAASQFVSESVGSRLLAGEVSDAKDAPQDDAVDHSSTSSGANSPSDDQPDVKPIDHMDIRLSNGDIAKVGITGLGIATLATLIPGIAVLRLKPREILTKGD
ncbi:ABC transporter permease [Streptomyces sp. NPDC050738]|uniref:ABC transporter permease n=1 Tax=Streptomyces sp. NPDC050738 TaxID=3154744 RepID=UPI0034380466